MLIASCNELARQAHRSTRNAERRVERGLGLGPKAIAVVLAAGTAIRLVAAPLAGRIADRLDASRAVLAASIAGAALLALGYLVTWGFWPLLLMSSAAAVALALGRIARRGPPSALSTRKAGSFTAPLSRATQRLSARSRPCRRLGFR